MDKTTANKLYNFMVDEIGKAIQNIANETGIPMGCQITIDREQFLKLHITFDVE